MFVNCPNIISKLDEKYLVVLSAKVIDELDKLCEEEKCFDDTCLEHLKLDRCCEFVTLENGHINSYLVKCPCCNGTNIKEIERDYIGSILAESDYYCENCKDVVAHWAYGSVMP